MDAREAKEFKRLKDENKALKEYVKKIQCTKDKTRARESPPPTKAQFNKMGYRDRVAFKQQYPEVYSEYVKK